MRRLFILFASALLIINVSAQKRGVGETQTPEGVPIIVDGEEFPSVPALTATYVNQGFDEDGSITGSDVFTRFVTPDGSWGKTQLVQRGESRRVTQYHNRASGQLQIVDELLAKGKQTINEEWVPVNLANTLKASESKPDGKILGYRVRVYQLGEGNAYRKVWFAPSLSNFTLRKELWFNGILTAREQIIDITFGDPTLPNVTLPEMTPSEMLGKVSKELGFETSECVEETIRQADKDYYDARTIPQASVIESTPDLDPAQAGGYWFCSNRGCGYDERETMCIYPAKHMGCPLEDACLVSFCVSAWTPLADDLICWPENVCYYVAPRVCIGDYFNLSCTGGEI